MVRRIGTADSATPPSAPAGDKPPHYIPLSPPLWIPAFAGMTIRKIDGTPRHNRSGVRGIFVPMTNRGAGLTIWVGGATSWGSETVRFRPYDTRNRTLVPSKYQQRTSYTNEIWVNYAVHIDE